MVKTTVAAVIDRFSLGENTNKVFSTLNSDVLQDVLNIPVLFTINSVSRAGMYHSGHKTIHINQRLKYEHVPETFLHELAHGLCYFDFSNKHWRAPIELKRDGHHGRIWRRYMVQMGQEPDRCHKYAYLRDESDRLRWQYICSGCGAEFKSVRRGIKIIRPSVYHWPCPNGKGNRFIEKSLH